MGNSYLISRLSSLGDVVNTLPTAVALKRAFPDCKISWLVDPRFAGIVDRCSAVDRVIRWKPNLREVSKLDFGEEFTIAFDMQGLLKSAVPIWKSKAQRKLAYHWQREGASLFVPPVLPQSKSFHIVDQLLDVVRGAGIDVQSVGFDLHADEGDISNVMKRLNELGLSGRFVAINAGSAWPSKRWAPAHFALVIDQLSANGIQSVMIGTGALADREAADLVISECKSSPIDMLGQTSVVELIALLSRASAHVAGDTGSLHIANALGTPLVAMYSITKPHRTGPFGKLEFCHYDPVHLNNINPARVLDSIMSVL